MPNRTRFYLSKIVLIGGLAFLMGQVTGVLTFVLGQAFMGEYALSLGPWAPSVPSSAAVCTSCSWPSSRPV